MEEQMDNYDFGEANVNNPNKTIDNVTKSIKCKFASSQEGDLRRRLQKSQTNAANATMHHLMQAI